MYLTRKAIFDRCPLKDYDSNGVMCRIKIITAPALLTPLTLHLKYVDNYVQPDRDGRDLPL